MSSDDFLFTLAGGAYLQEYYVRQEKSTHVLADELGTYPNQVLRALRHHGLPVRTKAQAQQVALKKGRHRHPTRGRQVSRQTRERIGEGVGRAWERMSEEARAERVRLGRLQWERTPEADREELRRLATDAMRRARGEGSRLERCLAAGLREAGLAVEPRTRVAGRLVDLLLPDLRVAIQVDGPGHHLPVWGEERLARVVRDDAAATADLVAAGVAVVRVKNLVKNLSDIQARKLLTELVSVLQSGLGESPDVVEMEVK